VPLLLVATNEQSEGELSQVDLLSAPSTYGVEILSRQVENARSIEAKRTRVPCHAIDLRPPR
jgi:hypothetical protein